MVSDKIDKFNSPYDPKKTEPEIYKRWEESGFFNPDNLEVAEDAKSYTIVLPPPNVTGTLHMGHALNATIQDILIRRKRMQGFRTLWLPGTDHAGIATQNVVEKMLKKEGVSRHDLGKEKFIEKVWEWKEKYGDIILGQLRTLGASCDWSRATFTMDENYKDAVSAAFKHYYDKGLIYQGERVINWCSRCATSLSDLELEYKEEKGVLYYIRYPLATRYVVVATTRPETMLGDTAVAVNPKDERYKDLIGKTVILPIQEKEIPIVADDAIDPAFGTGAVKVTPAHSIIDSEIGARHNLPAVKIINERGKMTAESKICEGLNAEDCRKKVAEELTARGLLEKTEDIAHNVSHCYRCDRVIEQILSKQWFVKMDGLAPPFAHRQSASPTEQLSPFTNEQRAGLAKKAIEAVRSGKIKIHPRNFEKIYFDWLENTKDWCVSRQIWWGHKIPLDGVDDVLDTWFSSALWPFATLGWPSSAKATEGKPSDLDRFYPTQVLSTARDIINLWVSRMIFSGLEFMGEIPFSDVYIHPTILTKDGKRMSKSLGTGIDPLTLVEKYGADATRFGLIWQNMGGQDIHFAEEHILAGKKFANKLWNIARFVLGQIGKSKIRNPKSEILKQEDREIIEKLENTIRSVNENIDSFQFGQALHILYDFVWRDFADQYIEFSKTSDAAETKQTLVYVLSNILKLLHPFMPFVTEEIYSSLPADPSADERRMLIVENWPEYEVKNHEL